MRPPLLVVFAGYFSAFWEMLNEERFLVILSINRDDTFTRQEIKSDQKSIFTLLQRETERLP